MSSHNHRALLIVDMQVGLFHGADQPHDGARVLAAINRLIARARAARAPIFAARHVGPPGSPLAPDSALTQLIPELHVDASRDGVFEKRRPSCFAGTALAERLAQARVDELVIAGMKTEYCVDTTCRAAADLGFKTLLAADAHTSMDTPVLPAAAIVAHHNRTLDGAFVTLVNADECAF
ncbi:isochorismatase family protein [Paraburkholderia acidisoli]|uniref:Isochorismatase family protein n=1 Tax=Paraburkholderia acidisoli TaxID=2571748 RepID=A0A7Z2GNM6_9BURK|nr:isochorismatase family protein [Paraburkholderia acidisoli]QGZ65115.1 isochorismatase family protein [Paraburkholderia acidisoli]